MNEFELIRRKYRQIRRNLSKDQQFLHSRRIVPLSRQVGWLWRARRIGVYSAVAGELDLQSLIVQLSKAGKHVYLPIVLRKRRILRFAESSPRSIVKLNRYGILEPVVAARSSKQARQLDVLMVPLVAFDATCNRLGMGGGYYDRTLSYRLRSDHWQRPHLLGIAHECQKIVSPLPVRPWDVPMDTILTERCVYRRFYTKINPKDDRV